MNFPLVQIGHKLYEAECLWGLVFLVLILVLILAVDILLSLSFHPPLFSGDEASL